MENNINSDDDLMQDPFAQDSGVNTDIEMQTQGNADSTLSTDTNEVGNHQPKGDKIDLTQDSDSDDSIVEVGEVNEDPSPGAQRELFKQEGGGYAPQSSSVYTHPTPYQCGVCQKAFDNVQMLENHNKLEHTSGASDGVAVMATGSTIQQQQDMMTFKLEPNRQVCSTGNILICFAYWEIHLGFWTACLQTCCLCVHKLQDKYLSESNLSLDVACNYAITK